MRGGKEGLLGSASIRMYRSVVVFSGTDGGALGTRVGCIVGLLVVGCTVGPLEGMNVGKGVVG